MEEKKKKIINKLLNEIKRGKDESIIPLYEIISPTLRYIALRYLKKEEDKAKFLLICIVAALPYMVYGVYTKAKHNKVYIVNHTIDEGNTAEGEDKI